MQAYVSLHAAEPNSQLDNEVFYKGYGRIPIEFDQSTMALAVDATFPAIEEYSDDVVTYIAIGAVQSGQGEIFMRIPILPHIPLTLDPELLTNEFWERNGITGAAIAERIEAVRHFSPRIKIINTNPVTLPDNLNPIARVAHNLVYSGLLDVGTLPPKLFEAINDALHNAGVPVLQVKREAAAEMNGKMSQLKSLSLASDTAGNA